jgi:hypothetical protein
VDWETLNRELGALRPFRCNVVRVDVFDQRTKAVTDHDEIADRRRRLGGHLQALGRRWTFRPAAIRRERSGGGPVGIVHDHWVERRYGVPYGVAAYHPAMDGTFD